MVRGEQIVGEIPPEYNGPIWYHVVRRSFKRNTRLPLSIPAKLANPLFDESEERLLFPASRVMDVQGRFLSTYDRPVAFSMKNKPSRRVEFVQLSAPIVTERVHNAIVSLDSSPFIFIALDAHLPDTGVERWYVLYYGETWSADVLDPMANHLELTSFHMGQTPFYPVPDWFCRGEPHFGYLKAEAVAQRHLIPTGQGLIISSQLAELIADAFCDDYKLVPMGIA